MDTQLNMIFDRTQDDVDRVSYLANLWTENGFTGTTEELAEWASDLKGAYNASDLNRVLSAVGYLTDMLYDMGYNVPTVVPEKKTRYVAKEIEYIESTGTQYIDTGFKPNQDTRVVTDIQVLDTQTGEGHICSVAESSYYTLFFDSSKPSWYGTRYGGGPVRTFPDQFNTRTRYTIDKDKNITKINGYSISESSYSFQTNHNLPIFCRITNGSLNAYIKARLYSFKIYDNGTLVRDFKPYYDSNGIVCLYDAVEQSYYYNSGTGEFIASEQPTAETAYWFDADIPQQSQMDIYINNIQLLRDILPYVAPDAPETATGLSYQSANNIEEILYTLESVLLAMQDNFKLRQANTFFMTAGGVFNNA